ncbi:hypothetical protein Tco_0282403 [Tanacetum coccineum]
MIWRLATTTVVSKFSVFRVNPIQTTSSNNDRGISTCQTIINDDQIPLGESRNGARSGRQFRMHLQPNGDQLVTSIQKDGSLLSLSANLSVEERIAFNVSLRMFTRRVVIQRRVEDLQLGVESYQKKLNLTKPDTYRSNLRRQDAYTPYSDPRGFIYENKDKKNRLMRIDELHKFSDGTLDDVRTALNDRLKGIRMEYLPQTFWSQRDKANARAMIQAIDKRLKTRRIMRSQCGVKRSSNTTNSPSGESRIGARSDDSSHLTKVNPRKYTYLVNIYKAVRLRFSDPMIQPEPEGSTQGYPLDSVEVLRVIHSQLEDGKFLLESTSNKVMVGNLCQILYESNPCGQLEERIGAIPIRITTCSWTMDQRFQYSAGNPVKEDYSKLILSDHRLCKMVVEVPDPAAHKIHIHMIIPDRQKLNDANINAFQDGMACRSRSRKSTGGKVTKDGVEIVA